MAFEVVSWTTPLERGRYVPLHSCIDVSAASIGRDLYVRNREGEVSPWDMDNRSLMIVCNRRICGGDLISLPPMHGASSFHHHAIPFVPARSFVVSSTSANNVTIICAERGRIEGQRVWILNRADRNDALSPFSLISTFSMTRTILCLKYQRIDETLTKKWLWLAIYFFFSNVGS